MKAYRINPAPLPSQDALVRAVATRAAVEPEKVETLYNLLSRSMRPVSELIRGYRVSGRFDGPFRREIAAAFAGFGLIPLSREGR